MSNSLTQFRERALKRPAVRKAYDELEEEFAVLNQVLKARVERELVRDIGIATATKICCSRD